MNFFKSLARISICGLLTAIAALAPAQMASPQARPAEKAPEPSDIDEAKRLNKQAFLYRSQGKYAEAEPLFKQVLAIAERALEPNDPALAGLLNNLASNCQSEGKYAEAEPLYQRALAIDEKALGTGHPNVARDLNNLA